MRGLLAALGAVLAGGMIAAVAPATVQAKETEEFEIGQWAGFSYASNDTGQFTDCAIWAYNRDKVQVGISILRNWTLELWLNSDAWNLPANQSYPISYWIDRNAQYHGKAETSSAKFAVIAVDQDQSVFDELKSGNLLTFRTQNEDYVFDLRGSSAALTRLLNCVDQYSKTASANPFGGGDAGNGNTENNQQQNSSQQQGGSQQSGGFEGTSQGSGNTSMSSFTVSTDDVRQFLVDVTGAKPSMITVNEKTDKNGVFYYDLKTPLGGGQFWQEKLDGGDFAAIVRSYVDGYKKDCDGSFEPMPQEPVSGAKGRLAVGTAACSSTKYQDNGPEFMSYSFMESDGIVSFYMTFVGGNAAKAKSDGLGKLIAKRSGEMIQ